MKTEGISKMTMGMMIAVAVFIDAVQAGVNLMDAIPYVGLILSSVISDGISIFAFLTFFLWFHLAGLKFNSKIAASTVGAFFIELIPVLNALPAWTLSVTTTLLFFQVKEVADKVAPEATKIIRKIAESDSKAA
ncbi:MAG: hypothetical protein KGJ58_01005 [Patescibacteria group bacterium]|nr:hypothetical protein [Patescibacteria group bacterium]MDE1988183.1 hypothetical protein [Patescibacteria group bacterium]MDE2218019.1 hypothetical protein [Patescibacteria group bacterium]